uniref:Secretory carrier-associated membrane protein n=1 Tax=Zea mays TaxID=4577 RepID=A0A804PLV3_MAIZE
MHHDPNPFDEGADENPFSNGGGGARGGGVKPQYGFRPTEPAGFGGGRGDATTDIPLDTMNDSKGKAKELSQWESDLRRRESDIRRREEALKSAGVPMEDKNWPPFFPIIHHDIANEIPANAQKLQYLAFASWLGIVLCLFWNFIAVIVCWIRGGDSKLFFLATIYGMLGIPLSYLMWYRPLYRAMRGILAAIDTFSDHAIVGIFYFVGFALFCLETLVSIWVLQKVYMYFRGHK